MILIAQFKVVLGYTIRTFTLISVATDQLYAVKNGRYGAALHTWD